jgi:hypothetical protein
MFFDWQKYEILPAPANRKALNPKVKGFPLWSPERTKMANEMRGMNCRATS